MKELFLLRGLPGAGKSTLAKSLGGKHIEADMYFEYEVQMESQTYLIGLLSNRRAARQLYRVIGLIYLNKEICLEILERRMR